MDKRGQELCGKSGRVAAIQESKLCNVFVLGAVIGAKQQVPDYETVRVVRIRLLDNTRMMPTVNLRAAYDVVQPAETYVTIGMLEQPAHGIEDEIICEHVRANTDEDERQTVAYELQRAFSAGWKRKTFVVYSFAGS